MLKWLMKRKLRAFGAAFDYDTRYAADLIDADPAAGLALARLSKVASYGADAPAAAWYAAKIVVAMGEDCGPCVQLTVTMAKRGGVSEADLRAIVTGDIARMTAEASLGYRFAQALLARSPELDVLRGEILRRWGERALAAICINIVATRTFPALKYGIGHGQSCRSVQIGSDMIAPGKPAHA